MQNPTENELIQAESRREAYMNAIPKEVIAQEDRLPIQIQSMNASNKSKLQNIYLVAEELFRLRPSFVACKEGCSSCCHMNISITSEEASRISTATAQKAKEISFSISHPLSTFAGKPCPFLDISQGNCSIYPDRPLACRKHVSFFDSATYCDVTIANDISVPLMGFSGLDNALYSVKNKNQNLVIADIRDFFPSTK
ncbi:MULTISPECIES: YkgJ family cysteine cluster protein [Deefgea]|nr:MULTISPECIES: YkgJ family cysteine cluster protein [Deefgea]MBM9890246.1 YkgJ family cysteine cluster protein [Deefgea sp. CFH1-16]